MSVSGCRVGSSGVAAVREEAAASVPLAMGMVTNIIPDAETAVILGATSETAEAAVATRTPGVIVPRSGEPGR